MKAHELYKSLKANGISAEIRCTNQNNWLIVNGVKRDLRHHQADVIYCNTGQPLVVVSAKTAQKYLIGLPAAYKVACDNYLKECARSSEIERELEVERQTSENLRQQLAARNNQHPETKPRRGLLVTLFPWRRV